MTWSVVSYTDVRVPIKPYTNRYLLVIVENEDGERLIARANPKHSDKISTSSKGTISHDDHHTPSINIFTPYEKNDVEDSPPVALVTGSSRGIGKAIALSLARNGFDVVVNSVIDEAGAINVVNEIKKLGQRSFFAPADVSDPVAVKSLISNVIESYGRLDVLVNNAGIVEDKLIDNLSLSEWEHVIQVNLTGTFNCSKEALPHMRNQNSGKIINIASVIGQIGNIGQANYSASKAGIIAFTKSMAKECAKDNVLVNAVAPGFIDTDMVRRIPPGELSAMIEKIPLGRLGKPHEVAGLVLFLASDKSNYITGQVFNINGGLYM